MTISMLWQMLLIGYVILLVAIILNALARILSLSTWYDIFINIQTQGFLVAWKNEGFFSLLFLLVLYPFVLGAVGYIMTRLFQ
jgi:hypothetical protein